MQSKGLDFIPTKPGKRGERLREVGYRESQRYNDSTYFFIRQRINTRALKVIEIIPSDQSFKHIVYPPSSSTINPQKKWESFIWEQQLAQLCSTPRPQDPTKNPYMIQFFINLKKVFRHREAQAMSNQKSVSEENNTPRTRGIKTSIQVAALLKPQNPLPKK